MSCYSGPEISNNQLIFQYDDKNTKKSWIGRPTTNLINPVTSAISRYNNPGFSGTAVNTGKTYKGCPIWELTFVAQNSTFISRLASTEGFGAIHNMPALSTGTRYLSSIYVKTDFPLQNTSSKGFTNTYANITGWGQNGTTTAQYEDDGWIRLYTQYYNSVNGYSARNNSPTYSFVVNTTSTQTIDLMYTIPANGAGISDFATLYAFVAAAPSISSNGGVTGITIVNHGLDTTNFTKLSWPSSIKLKTDLPFNYYVRVSVPSTGGVNKTISFYAGLTTYHSALTDSKFWKITFDTTNLAVGQVIKTYWCCPMIEQHDTAYPSVFSTSTRSATQAIKDLTGNTTLTASNLTYGTDGNFAFDGVSSKITADAIPMMSNTNFSCEVVFTPTSFTNTQVLICPQSAGLDHFISIGIDSKVGFQLTTDMDIGNRAYVTTSALQANKTYCLTCVKNGSSIAIYINGKLDSSSTTDTLETASWGNSQWSIGQRGNGQFPFVGKINSVRAYNKSLSADEVQQNFEAIRSRYEI